MKKINNIKLNYIKLFTVISLLTGAFSCQDILEEDVISRIGNDYLNTPNGFNDGVNAAYSTLRMWYGTEAGNNFTVFGTDTYRMGSDGSWKFINEYTNQFDSRTGQLNQIWDEFYRGINTCNAIIERAPDVPNVPDATKRLRVAEVKFLRAHHYFILVQLFGGVDLRLTETLVPTKEASRASVPQIYEAIIRDLEEAIADLLPEMRSNNYGRVTRPAAEHLLGKVYLTKATSEAGSPDDYSKAEVLLKKVISDYGFILLPDFEDVHRFNNEVNDEVIFAVQYTRDPLTNGGGNNGHVFFLMEYDIQPGMRRDTQNGRPFKRYRPTDYTLNVIFADRENDSRYDKSFKHVFFSNRPGNFNTTFDTSKPEVSFSEGDTAIYLPGVEWSEAERAAKPYQVLTPSLYTDKLYPTLNKFLDPGRADLTQFQGGRDYLAFRLADTYLMLGEALFRQGKTAEAVEAINTVRRRAAFPGREAQMEITASQLDMEFIMEERERELLGEQMRWLDLKRWGLLVERTRLHNPDAAPNIRDFHILRPIPQNQIDRVDGGESSFPQNPGY
ncbi:RagB/SusD family nutrient uptake outer membrane protein [Cecembia lonarensis]|uniref:SusD family protein n=1 Tax=Cecembia lonarensis (strain CCUG 58316 / KCTC 22772 / LW9) TaxID=1225176 RepID=K1L1R8_CECL9|nr:RagB/SusD family nutrient uptake outer membrane protein [Cecembia lonarensis]EKB50315.1 SusD family protein [Cecembia lonarensis LW9]